MKAEQKASAKQPKRGAMMFWREFSLSKTAFLLMAASLGIEQISGVGQDEGRDYELAEAGKELNQFVLGLPRVLAGRMGEVGRSGVAAIIDPSQQNVVRERENVDHLVSGLRWVGQGLQRDLPPKAGNAIETKGSAR